MAALRAEDYSAYYTILDNMKKKAGTSGELAPAYSEVAVPVAKAMNKFVNEDYRQALDGLLPVQGSLWRMGGSIAQRDLIEWTLLEVAIRAGEEKIAQSLVNERLSSKPDSHVNARFLGHIEA